MAMNIHCMETTITMPVHMQMHMYMYHITQRIDDFERKSLHQCMAASVLMSAIPGAGGVVAIAAKSASAFIYRRSLAMPIYAEGIIIIRIIIREKSRSWTKQWTWQRESESESTDMCRNRYR